MGEYDQTEVPLEEQDNFVDGVHFALKKDLYAAEESLLLDVQNDLTRGIDEGIVTAEDLLRTGVLRSLHEQAFGPIWKWAGSYRRLRTNIGVKPHLIHARLAEEMDMVRWFLQEERLPEVIAMQLHARTVSVHPFVDGNGRITRLYANVVLYSLAGTIFDFSSDGYFPALHQWDETGDVLPLLRATPAF